MGVTTTADGVPSTKRFKSDSSPTRRKPDSSPTRQSRYNVVQGRAQLSADPKRLPPVKLTVKLDRDAIRPCQVRVVNSSISQSTVKVEQLKEEDDSLNLDLNMTSSELLEACEAMGHKDGNISTSVLPYKVSDPACRPRSKPNTVLTKDELLPRTACLYVKTKEEAFSPQLLEFCLHRPIVVVRNLATACDLDLSLYTTKTLVEMHPQHPVEIRTQMEQTSDENWDPTMSQEVWYCTSSRSHTTIAKYAEYQASTLKEYLDAGHTDLNPKVDFTGQATRKMIKFGTNCDLSDERKWGPQLKELMKLPAWCRVVSAGNMLSHVGHQILGMNTVQLYMKVPCARTPGHQENNNFCAVNLNIGPGDSEWFGVPDEYWGALQKMCEDNGLDYLHGSWWPKMADLMEAGIPVYRFMQRPGDLVWVNAGCVHWVQASGWCNNIAWNVGPLSHRQYKLAMERYEWNKSQRYQSIVAMMHLSWNFAKNLKLIDRELHTSIKTTLMHSIRQTVQMLAFAKHCGIKIRFHGKKKSEPAHYCGVCDEEVFNVLFVKENEKRHVVHCLKCARNISPDLKGIVCLEEYPVSELLEIYDNFKLVRPATA